MYIREFNQSIIEENKTNIKGIIINNVALSYIRENKQLNNKIYDLVFIGYDQLKERIIPFKISIVASRYDHSEVEFLESIPVNIDTHKNIQMSAKAVMKTVEESGLLSVDLVGDMSKFYYTTYTCNPDLYMPSRFKITRLMIHFPAYLQLRLFLDLFLKKECKMNIFSGDLFNNMNSINIEYIHLNGSSTKINHIYSHYTMGCGPKQYKLVKKSEGVENPRFREPVDPNIFFASYYKSRDNSEILYEVMDWQLDVVLLYVKEKDSITVLRLPREIYLESNFGEDDKRYILIKEDDK